MQLLQNVLGTSSSSSKRTRTFTIKGRTYEESDLISEGGFAFVYRAREKGTGQAVAIKRVLCHDKASFETAYNEAQLLKQLPPHPNIVRYLGATVEESSGSDGRSKTREVISVLELCEGGHLVHLIDRHKGNVPLGLIQKVIVDLATCLEHLHCQNPPVLHCDLKVENVLLSQGTWKLCDFGSCIQGEIATKSLDSASLNALQEAVSKRTTMMYRPPELVDFFQRAPIGTSVDIWMLGCVLYSLAFSRHPFQDVPQFAIVNANFDLPSTAEKRLSPLLLDLLFWMLAPNGMERPTATQVLQTIAQKEPQDRLDLPTDVLKHRELLEKRLDQRLSSDKAVREQVKTPSLATPLEKRNRKVTPVATSPNPPPPSPAPPKKADTFFETADPFGAGPDPFAPDPFSTATTSDPFDSDPFSSAAVPGPFATKPDLFGSDVPLDLFAAADTDLLGCTTRPPTSPVALPALPAHGDPFGGADSAHEGDASAGSGHTPSGWMDGLTVGNAAISLDYEAPSAFGKQSTGDDLLFGGPSLDASPSKPPL